jgi:hypothetical protein
MPLAEISQQSLTPGNAGKSITNVNISVRDKGGSRMREVWVRYVKHTRSQAPRECSRVATESA